MLQSFVICSIAVLLLIPVFECADTEKLGCPPGWDYGDVCGTKNCYRIVSVPDAKRIRQVDDNFCAEFDKASMPAIIRCEEENTFLGTLPKFTHLATKRGLGLGLYIPANKPWGRNNFVNRDGSKVQFLKWGFISGQHNQPREPNPGGEKLTVVMAWKQGNSWVNTWHDIASQHGIHLLCKRPAAPQPPPLLPVETKHDISKGSYVCPAGFDLGNVCGTSNCYRIVSVPEAQRSRMVDDNFCEGFASGAEPAIIRCHEENEYLVTFPDNAKIAETSGFALGLYIPLNKPWGQNNFFNRDGSNIEYLNWGIYDSPDGLPYKEPNGFLNSFGERVVQYRRFKVGNTYDNTWHDVGYPVASHLLCKVSATFQPTLPKMADEFESYSCPEGWILGDKCGQNHCYRIYPVPANKKPRLIEDNYCGEIDKNAMPAIIRCEEENEFLSTSPFAPTAINEGFTLGLYMPASGPWDPTKFVNRDGSKVEYLKWGLFPRPTGPVKEPTFFIISRRRILNLSLANISYCSILYKFLSWFTFLLHQINIHFFQELIILCIFFAFVFLK